MLCRLLSRREESGHRRQAGPAGGEGVGDIKGFCIQHPVAHTLLPKKLAKGSGYPCHRTTTLDLPSTPPQRTHSLWPSNLRIMVSR